MPFFQIKKGIFDTLRSAAIIVGVVSEIEDKSTQVPEILLLFSLFYNNIKKGFQKGSFTCGRRGEGRHGLKAS